MELGFEYLEFHPAVAVFKNSHRLFGIIPKRDTGNFKQGMNGCEDCRLAQAARLDARDQIPSLLQNTAGVNSSEVASLNPDQAYKRPQRRNATVHKRHDCRFDQNDDQQHQKGADLEYRSGHRPCETMEYDGGEQNLMSLLQFSTKLHK